MTEEPHNPRAEDVGRQTDDRLVHALLLHIHDPQAGEHHHQRVDRVMQSIGGSEQEPSQSASGATRRAIHQLQFPVWVRRGAWAAAAMILLALGIFTINYSSSAALASLDEIVKSLGRPGDRTFRIRAEPPAADPPDRPGLDQSTLYLRDGNQYVLVRSDPKGGEALDGYDGRQSWRIRAGVLVETKDGRGAGGIPMPQVMADVPFVDLQQTLERIRADYVIEQCDQASLQSGRELLRHILARRKSHDVKGPETVEIWANSQTGMPRRIVFSEAQSQGSPQPRRLTIDLASQAPLPVNWFTHGAHEAEPR